MIHPYQGCWELEPIPADLKGEAGCGQGCGMDNTCLMSPSLMCMLWNPKCFSYCMPTCNAWISVHLCLILDKQTAHKRIMWLIWHINYNRINLGSHIKERSGCMRYAYWGSWFINNWALNIYPSKILTGISFSLDQLNSDKVYRWMWATAIQDGKINERRRKKNPPWKK